MTKFLVFLELTLELTRGRHFRQSSRVDLALELELFEAQFESLVVSEVRIARALESELASKFYGR